MRVGQVCPKGFLPIYSVDTEEEAHRLVEITCPRNPDGTYFSRHLAEGQSIERLFEFGEQLDKAHQRMESLGRCSCKPLPSRK